MQSRLVVIIMTGACLFCQTTFKKREKKYKFCSLTCSNSYNRNGLHQVKLPSRSTDLAEFIGICLGDGTSSRYQTCITLNATADKDYIPYITALISRLFQGANVSLVQRPKDNAVEIKINSCIVSEFMQSMSIIPKKKYIPIWIKQKSEFRQACIRGLFDTEGSISYKKYQHKNGISIYKQLTFRNTDKKLMLLVRDTLLQIKLHPTMTLKKSLYVSNNKSIQIYKETIGFSNPKLLRRSIVNTLEDYNGLANTIRSLS